MRTRILFSENFTQKKSLLRNKGVSLIEIVLSLAILGILTVTFFSIFTNGYKSITDTGRKGVAIGKASETFELLYTLNSLNISDLALDDFLTSGVSDGTAFEVLAWGSPSLSVYSGANTVLLAKTPTTLLTGGNGYKVKVVVFYNGGENSVSLTSFYKGG